MDARHGPTDVRHYQIVPWYPDELKFMRNLVIEHPMWTYQQYAEVNTRQFANTFYTDSNSGRHSEMRHGRNANNVAARLGTFINKVRHEYRSRLRAQRENDVTSRWFGGHIIDFADTSAGENQTPRSASATIASAAHNTSSTDHPPTPGHSTSNQMVGATDGNNIEWPGLGEGFDPSEFERWLDEKGIE